MKARTKTEIEEGLDMAEANRDEAAQDTINRLRYAFSDLAEHDLRMMALRHPDVIRERRYWQRRIRAHRRALAALKDRRKART
jgi:hypothetical protein